MISPLIYSHADYVKQNDKNQETITSRFFPEQKTKKSFVLRHLSPVHKVLTGIWKPLSGQIVSSSIHFNVVRESVHECTFDRQPGNFQNYASGNHISTSAYMLKIEKLSDHLQHDLYMDTSYKFTLAWVFVSHACIRRTMNTFINDFICLQGFRANESTAYSIIMSQDHFHNSPQHYFM